MTCNQLLSIELKSVGKLFVPDLWLINVLLVISNVGKYVLKAGVTSFVESLASRSNRHKN